MPPVGRVVEDSPPHRLNILSPREVVLNHSLGVLHAPSSVTDRAG